MTAERVGFLQNWSTSLYKPKQMLNWTVLVLIYLYGCIVVFKHDKRSGTEALTYLSTQV